MKKIFLSFLCLLGFATFAMADYYVTGTSNLGHDNGKKDSWDAQQLKMTDGTLTLTNRPAGDYEMKVTVGDWGTAGEKEFGWGQLDKEASSKFIKGNSGNNICFTLLEAGDVQVSIADKKVTVIGSTIGRQYYLTGIDGWSEKQKKMNADGTISLQVSAGEHEIRVTRGNWDDPLDFYDLDNESSSPYLYVVKPDHDKNIGFYMPEPGGNLSVQVTADEKLIVTGDMVALPINYTHIAGAEKLAASGDWNEKRYQLENGSKTINLPAGEHQMKITDGTWNHQLTFANVNTETSSPYIYTKGSDGNIWFYLSEQSDVTISVVEQKVVVVGDKIAQRPITYYITGIEGQHELDKVTHTYTKKDLNNGVYNCKINDGESGDGHEWGYNQINQELSNIHLEQGDNNNIRFSLNKKSDMIFQMVDDKVVINQQYYVTGIGDWNERQIPMELYSRTYTATLPAGGYECKVTAGNWDNTLTHNDLDESSSANVYTTSGGNIAFVLAEEGQVTIKVTNENKVVVTGNFVKSATYTLEGNGGDDATGTWCHGKDWNTSASQMYDNTITFNDVPKGTWKCKVTNAGKTFEWGYTEVDLDQSSCLVKCESVQDNGIRIELPYVADITVTVVNPDAEKKIVVLVSPAQLDETVDNTTLINDIHNKTVDAQLLRTFVADGYWYTLCLPFDLTAEQIAASIGDCRLMKLNSSYMKSAETLYLDFKEESTVEAGVPYLFMPNNDVETPTFKAVKFNKNASLTVNTEKASMTGFYQPTVVEMSNYFLGENNYLMKNNDASQSKAFRAYFTLDGSVPAKVMARVVFGQDAPTRMDEVNAVKSNRLIMYNGHIFIEKEGIRYTLIGQKL